jgi:hypothetical protein
MHFSPTLSRHQAYSTRHLNELVAGTASLTDLHDSPGHCIFATGAFARHEANAGSGIDLFVLAPQSSSHPASSSPTGPLVMASLTRLLHEINLPGEVVATYSASELVQSLGTSQDEQQGYWPTRMLYLLESVPIYNPAAYEALGRAIATAYITNFHRHNHELPAVFLIYDIMRYWKTTCLSYEHTRDYSDIAAEHRYLLHLRNLKLAYSKKLACYSFILLLLLRPQAMTANLILAITRLKPVERLLHLAQELPAIQSQVDEVLALFSWFLEVYDQPQAALQQYIEDPKKRKTAFDKSRAEFSQQLLNLVLSVTRNTPEVLKYLVI